MSNKSSAIFYLHIPSMEVIPSFLFSFDLVVYSPAPLTLRYMTWLYIFLSFIYWAYCCFLLYWVEGPSSIFSFFKIIWFLNISCCDWGFNNVLKSMLWNKIVPNENKNNVLNKNRDFLFCCSFLLLKFSSN